MKLQKNIDIYLLRKRSTRIVELVQYDTGIQLVFTVKDFEVPSGTTATLFVRKPSGKFVYQEENVLVSGNTITIDLENQSITEFGSAFYQIELTNGEDVISTFSGEMYVNKSLADDGATESVTVIRAFDEVVESKIAEIVSASEEQINAKAANALASIPEEYTELQNSVDVLYNSVANGIKNSVSGEAIAINDASTIEHEVGVKVSGNNIDPTNVTVMRSGKNFWQSGLTYPRTVSGVTIDYDEETQVYTFNGTSTSAGDIYTMPNNTHIMNINAGETWTLKVHVVGGDVDGVASSSGKISPLVNTTDYSNTIHANTESMHFTKTYTESADVAKMYFYVYGAGTVFNNFQIRVQLELSDSPTEFEVFKEYTEYTPSSDGTVEGITSLSPNMTLLTDTEGVVIDCEYIVDTKTYIDNKFEEIKALIQ